ncbi:MAG: DinB family protein [Planctomycetota bacterium]
MSIKQSIIDSVAYETRVIKHLATRVPDDAWDYRPSEGQRSTLELIQYLSRCGVVGMELLLSETRDRVKLLSAEGKETTRETFAAEMDKQQKMIEDMLAPLTDSDLLERRCKAPWQDEMPLLRGLIDVTIKFLACYRMQLFLYAKAAGAANLTTSNSWGGRDREAPKPAAS